MCIRIQSIVEENTHFIVFRFVEYFSGSTHWKGADFIVESDDKCVQLLQGMSRFRDLPPAVLADRYKLYTLENSEDRIQIIAAIVYLADQYP